MMNLLQLAAKMAVVEAELKLANEGAIAAACEILAEECRSAIGTYRYGWQQLADATMEERSASGYPADEPLLRTGELRASIEWNANSHEGYVGSDNPKMVWHEWGTSRVPARPVLGGALEASRPEIEKMLGRIAACVAAGDLEGLKHRGERVCRRGGKEEQALGASSGVWWAS